MRRTPPARRPRKPATARWIAALASAALAGCTNGPDSEPLPLPSAEPIAQAVRQAQHDWPWIAGTEWELAAIEGEDPLPGVRVWISFRPNETWLTGSAGCNRMTGQYVRRGEDGLRIGPVTTTRMFCNEPAGVMQQESRVVHLLGETQAYRASREWLHLVAEDRIVLTFRAVTPAP